MSDLLHELDLTEVAAKIAAGELSSAFVTQTLLDRIGALDGDLQAFVHLNAAALGYGIMVFALVSLRSQAEEDLRAFEAHVAALPQVRECHMLNGEIDFILKIVAHDLQSFQLFLTSELTTAPHVTSVKTSLTIRTAKDEPGIPVDEA